MRLDGSDANVGDPAPSGFESGDVRRDEGASEKNPREKRHLQKKISAISDVSRAALRRLAGDDAADDAIVREHAMFGKRSREQNPKKSNERDEGYGQRVSKARAMYDCRVGASFRRAREQSVSTWIS
jgi:hypothetical protein